MSRQTIRKAVITGDEEMREKLVQTLQKTIKFLKGMTLDDEMRMVSLDLASLMIVFRNAEVVKEGEAHDISIVQGEHVVHFDATPLAKVLLEFLMPFEMAERLREMSFNLSLDDVPRELEQFPGYMELLYKLEKMAKDMASLGARKEIAGKKVKV